MGAGREGALFFFSLSHPHIRFFFFSGGLSLGVFSVRRRGVSRLVEREEEGEAQKKDMVEKVQSVHHESVYFEDEERQKGKRKSKKGETPRSETNLGKVWEVAFSPFAAGVEWAMCCQCCSRRTAEKDGGDDEDTVGSAGKQKADGWRRFHKGGGNQKEKTGLRRRRSPDL